MAIITTLPIEGSTPSPARGIQAGDKLGRYTIEGELGQGGMSTVFRGHDPHLKRAVAIKVMHPFMAERSEARERFKREAEAVARLKHPNIVEIFDTSAPEETETYLVMELIEGCSLAQFVDAHGPLLPEAATALALPVCDALDHAHSKGIIHRDLKPENVMVSPSGQVKLTDFGIARLLDSSGITMTGTLLGSPAYMAPEYIEGKVSDSRADLFSFGAMLYQMCTKALPFDAKNPTALMRKIVTGDYVPPQAKNNHIHSTLAGIIERCLTTEVHQRFPNARALHDALLAFLGLAQIHAQDAVAEILKSPEDFESANHQHLISSYERNGDLALKNKKRNEALQHYDRVLCLDPKHQKIRRYLSGVARRQTIMHLAKRIGMAASIIAAIGLIGVQAWQYFSEKKPKSVAQEEQQNTPPPPLPTPKTIGYRDITVVATGPGMLFIDGEKQNSIRTQPRSFSLSAGAHIFKLVTAGGSTQVEVQVPTQGDVPLVRLEAKKLARPKVETPIENGPVTLMVLGSFGDIYIDNKLHTKNAMNKVEFELAHGEYDIEVRNPAFEAKAQRVVVGQNLPRRRLLFQLLPKPASLKLQGAPNGALVAIAGQTRLLTDGNRRLPLTIELGKKTRVEYQLQVSHAGFKTYKKSLRFRPGEEKTLKIELNRQ